MFAEEQWYQNPIVVVAFFAFITTGLQRLAKRHDDAEVRRQKLEDEKSRKEEKEEDERHREQKEARDNARQDVVAEQVAEAAKIAKGASAKVEEVAVQASKAADLLVESNISHLKTAEITIKKLETLEDGNKEIIAFVDGNLTAAKLATVVALRNEIQLAEEYAAFRKTAGQPFSGVAMRAIDAKRTQADVLDAEINDRLEKQQLARDQIDQDRRPSGEVPIIEEQT